jgi:DNA ligase-4
VDLQGLHKIACESIGRDNSDKNARDICNGLWGKTTSPRAKSEFKRKATRELWEDRLALLDGRKRRRISQPILKENSPPSRSSLKDPFRNSTSQPLGTRTNTIAKSVSFHLPSSEPVAAIPMSEEQQSPSLRACKNPTPQQTPEKGGESYMNLDSSEGSSDITTPDVSDIVLQDKALETPTNTPPSGMTFLHGALVWFATSGTKHCPSSLALKSALPRQQRLHSLESLLLGCGWHQDTAELPWVERGVIFVDGGDMGKVLGLIEERRRTLLPNQPRKSIYIFDVSKFPLDGELVDGFELFCLK